MLETRWPNATFSCVATGNASPPIGGKGLNSTQKGKASEFLLASALILASNGRLSPYLPMCDDCGVDQLVFDKETHRALAIQIKSRIEKLPGGKRKFAVKKTAFRNHADRYLIAVFLDPNTMALAASWLIPMARLPELAGENQPKEFAVWLGAKKGSRDRFQDFRHDGAKELAAAILRTLNETDRHALSGSARGS